MGWLCQEIKAFNSLKYFINPVIYGPQSAHDLGVSHQEHWTRIQFRSVLAVPVQIPYSHPGQTQGTPGSDSATLLGAGRRTLLKIPPEFSNLLAGRHHTRELIRNYLEFPPHRGDGATRPKLLCCCQHPSSAFLETVHTDWYRERILSLSTGLPAGQEHKGRTWLVWKFKCLRTHLVKLIAVVDHQGSGEGDKSPTTAHLELAITSQTQGSMDSRG